MYEYYSNRLIPLKISYLLSLTERLENLSGYVFEL